MAPIAPRIDGASLVDPSLHSPAIVELINTELTRSLTDYIVDRVIDVVDFALGRPSSSARGRANSRRTTDFSSFARLVIERAGVHIPVLLGTLVYLDRAKPHLQLSLEEWACERVFLGALICANKYLNDSTLKNVHWSMCTGLFNKRDIGRIEREFLDVLDFELRITEADILAHHEPVMALKRTQAPRLRIATTAAKRPPFRHRADSDSSTSTDSSSPSDSLPPTPPEAPMDVVDAHVRSPGSDGSVYSDADDEDMSATLPRLLSPPPKEQKSKSDSVNLPRFSTAFNLLRNIPVPHFNSSS